jgi:hypothetical protein
MLLGDLLLAFREHRHPIAGVDPVGGKARRLGRVTLDQRGAVRRRLASSGAQDDLQVNERSPDLSLVNGFRGTVLPAADLSEDEQQIAGLHRRRITVRFVQGMAIGRADHFTFGHVASPLRVATPSLDSPAAPPYSHTRRI